MVRFPPVGNDLIRELLAVSLEMALRLTRLFGNSADFWLSAQRATGPDIRRVEPLIVSSRLKSVT